MNKSRNNFRLNKLFAITHLYTDRKKNTPVTPAEKAWSVAHSTASVQRFNVGARDSWDRLMWTRCQHDVSV